MKNTIASICHYAVALTSLIFGCMYLFKKEFMPYHSVAVGRSWDEVDAGMKVLILALMRAVSAGWLITAVVVAWLQWQFNKTKAGWIPLVILVAGLVSSSVTVYATTIVRAGSEGKPPTLLGVGMMVLFLAAYFLNRRYLKKNPA
ncbi:MAG: hypothetical protein JNL57_05120 [Bacteroidetes bacterium]|nr:hypothetical protein [Bacteroidota bacterium]